MDRLFLDRCALGVKDGNAAGGQFVIDGQRFKAVGGRLGKFNGLGLAFGFCAHKVGVNLADFVVNALQSFLCCLAFAGGQAERSKQKEGAHRPSIDQGRVD